METQLWVSSVACSKIIIQGSAGALDLTLAVRTDLQVHLYVAKSGLGYTFFRLFRFFHY